MTRAIRIGTRGSQLALTQTNWVAARLKELNPEVPVEIEIIKTIGDRVQDRPIEQIGVEGAFTKELDIALLEKRVDALVHSLKDLPTQPVEGIVLAAVPEREDPRDAFIGKTAARLADLPHGAVVGTSSLRRLAQLAAQRPDVKSEPMRGNVDTRLRKLRESSDLDAIILAAAGLRRLGLAAVITETLELERWLPAPGQGALAITARADDDSTQQVLQPLDHLPTRLAVTAERRLLARLEGGCHVPIGAHARVEEDELILEGLVASPDGKQVLRGEVRGKLTEAAQLGDQLAEILMKKGAAEILADLKRGFNRKEQRNKDT